MWSSVIGCLINTTPIYQLLLFCHNYFFVCFLSSNRVTTIIWDTFIVFSSIFPVTFNNKILGGFNGYVHRNAGGSVASLNMFRFRFFLFLLSLHTIHSFHQLISIIIWPGWTKLSCILWFLSKNEYIDGFHKFSLCSFLCQTLSSKNWSQHRNLQLPDTLHCFRVGMILFFQFWGGFVGYLLSKLCYNICYIE